MSEVSLSETMKAHMEAVRGVTGDTGKLSISEATDNLNKISGFRDNNIIFSGDANSLTSTGVWATHGALLNLPEHGPWGILTVFAPVGGKDYVKQEWTSINDNATYVRMIDLRANTINPWSKLGGVIRRYLTAITPRLEVVAC